MATAYYKIRLSWDGGKWTKTQKGAYTDKDQAIAACSQELIDQGYKVFSPEGEIVYPIYYNELAQRMVSDGITSDLQYWSDVFDGKTELNLEYIKTIIERYSAALKELPTPKAEKVDIDGVELFKIPVSLFRIIWHDAPKRSGSYKNVFNAGYFGGYRDDVYFTLPSANLVCDIDEDSVPDSVMKYLKERVVKNGKLYFSADKNSSAQFRGKNVSTLIIRNGKASIEKLSMVEDESISYAVSGVPVIEKGITITNSTAEGWDTSVARATWHTIVALKEGEEDFVYVGGINTTTSNCITSKEIAKKMTGFYSVLKLDGGGSSYGKFNGDTVYNTLENRQVNNVIIF